MVDYTEIERTVEGQGTSMERETFKHILDVIYMIVEVGTTIVLLFVCLDQQLGVLSLVMKI